MGECGAECERLQAFDTGAILYKAGEPGDSIFYVASGRVAVSRPDSDGVQRVAAVVERGELVGIDSFNSTELYRSTATALEPCTVCVIPRSVMGSDPAVISRLLLEMCQRLSRAESHI